MANPRVLRFDAEGRPLEFSVWLLRARRLLESQVQADESLWGHASGDLPKPDDPAPLGADPSSADSDRYARHRVDLTTWKSHDIVACIALSSLLPESEESHFTQHPSELTIEVLESALKDVKSNLRSVASASGAVPPPLFHGCTVPQLPTFFASLATATTDVTTKSVTTSSRSRGRSGRRGDQGAGGGGEGGGGGVASGGGGSTEVGGATHAAASDSPATAGGGDARVRQAPTGSPATGAGEAAWYLTQRQQQQ
ncbi:unnamed protein product [Closterium sp. NIES-53]